MDKVAYAAIGGATFDLINDFIEQLLANFGLTGMNINELATAIAYYYAAKKGYIPQEVAMGAIGAAASRVISIGGVTATAGAATTAPAAARRGQPYRPPAMRPVAVGNGWFKV